jgi:hypothetical protein
MGFYLVAASLQQYNTQIHILHTHQIHISHKIAPLKNKKKQISSLSYTSREGNITANGYNIEKAKK